MNRPRNILVVFVTLALVLHALYLASVQGPHCIDDAYISFRYAQNLAAGNGLVFNAGERVEGYTNFGWVLLTAAFTRIGIDVPTAVRVLDLILGGLLVVLALAFVGARARRPVATVLLAGLLLAADGSLARWSQEGMETVLFAFLVLAGAVLEVREMDKGGWLPSGSVVFALATLVRPEGLLFFVASVGLLLILERKSPHPYRDALVRIAAYAAIFAPYFLWRLTYFGYPLPNTFYAKVGGTAAQVQRGAAYLQVFFLTQRWPLILMAAAALLRPAGRTRARWQTYFLGLAATHLGYVLLVGGDWMGPGRFLLPIVALVYLPVVESATAAFVVPGGGTPLRAAAALVAAMLVGGQWVMTSWLSERKSIQIERPFSETRIAVARWLRHNAAPGDTLLANEIGQLGYFSGLYTDDVYGLTDPHIAHMRVEGMGGKKAGHEKMDLAYSFSKRPTWVCIPGIGRQFSASRAEFGPFAPYEAVTLPVQVHHRAYQVLLHRRTGS